MTASFHPVVGGAETYAWEVAAGLSARHHDVMVVTDIPRGFPPDEVFRTDPPGVTVRRLTGYRDLLVDHSKIYWEQMAFGLMPELDECIRGFRPDLIFTNSLDTALLGKTICLEHNLPWAAAFHEHAPQDEPLGPGRLRMVYGLFRPDLVLAGSKFYAHRALEWGGSDLPTALIYHGVDTNRFRPDLYPSGVREGYGVEADETLIVCSGRLKPRKGILELIRAFAALCASRERLRLLIVGSVSSASLDYAARLESAVKDLDMTRNVIIDQGITFDQMPQVLAAADLVAQPSFEEGLGIAVLEAMSTGRAVVTTDIPGIREIVTVSDVATLVPPGQVDRLAEALAELVDDLGRREQLGRAARRHVEDHFSRREMLASTESALMSITSGAHTEGDCDV